MDIDNSFEKTLNPCLKDAIAAYLEGEEIPTPEIYAQ